MTGSLEPMCPSLTYTALGKDECPRFTRIHRPEEASACPSEPWEFRQGTSSLLTPGLLEIRDNSLYLVKWIK